MPEKPVKSTLPISSASAEVANLTISEPAVILKSIAFVPSTVLLLKIDLVPVEPE